MEDFQLISPESPLADFLILVVSLALPLSLFVPGLFYAIRQRKKTLPGGPSKPGLIAGLLPIIASVAWALFFIVIYHVGYYREWLDRLTVSYKLFHYLIVPIAVPLFANLLWKKTTKSLKWERLALIGGFFVSVIACENTPASWTFTFMLIPLVLLILCVGFVFLRRSKPAKATGEPS